MTAMKPIRGTLLGRKLEMLHQFPHPHAQRGSDPQEGMQADPLLSALDFTHIYGMKIRFLRELFLAQAGPLPASSNRVAKDLPRIQGVRHKPQQKQTGSETNHTQHGFILILSFRRSVRESLTRRHTP